MKTIVILSGKGGTGKTTLAVNLSRAADSAFYLDCDVEEPNGHLFLKPENSRETSVAVEYPVIDTEKCTNCGACARFCRFHAFLSTPGLTITMPELCHDCGGCRMVCPQEAISYQPREIGTVSLGVSGKTSVASGILDVGELSGVKIIRSLKRLPTSAAVRIIDAPPGSSCAAAAAAEQADMAVVVTEPTPFGVHDMAMVVEMLREMKIPAGVVINKSGLGNSEVYDYCREEKLTILGELPFSRETAEISGSGNLLYEHSSGYSRWFGSLYNRIMEFGRETENGN